MLSELEAHAIAQRQLQGLEVDGAPAPAIAIIDEDTLERPTCFVFFYQSYAYLESGDFRDMLVGNAPVLIDRRSGEAYWTGSAFPIERYVEAFERTGDPSKALAR